LNAGIEDFLRNLDQDHRYIRNIVATEHREARSPQYAGIPSGLRPEITRLLQDLGISSLYSHQNTAIESILNKQNTLISSGVASGKSLCYHSRS
jgi:DEAD/DEAH box helicase domain-containing protein